MTHRILMTILSHSINFINRTNTKIKNITNIITKPTAYYMELISVNNKSTAKINKQCNKLVEKFNILDENFLSKGTKNTEDQVMKILKEAKCLKKLLKLAEKHELENMTKERKNLTENETIQKSEEFRQNYNNKESSKNCVTGATVRYVNNLQSIRRVDSIINRLQACRLFSEINSKINKAETDVNLRNELVSAIFASTFFEGKRDYVENGPDFNWNAVEKFCLEIEKKCRNIEIQFDFNSALDSKRGGKFVNKMKNLLSEEISNPQNDAQISTLLKLYNNEINQKIDKLCIENNMITLSDFRSIWAI